jgi:hypothetical protein
MKSQVSSSTECGLVCLLFWGWLLVFLWLLELGVWSFRFPQLVAPDLTLNGRKGNAERRLSQTIQLLFRSAVEGI